MIIRAIEKAFKHAKEKNWEKTYWVIDLHGTTIVPNYDGHKIPTDFYPHACEVLQILSARKDIVLILYTCSYPYEVKEYLEYFKKHQILFQYVGTNPEVKNGQYGYFNEKPYFNVMLEDKAGFDPDTDWERILEYLNK